MQRLVRSSLVGALTIVGLAACGDKVTVTQPPSQVVDGTVKNVSVSPANATVTVGGTTTLAAAVETGPGVTDHTVTWKSSNTAIATVSSAGVVTGVAVGSTTIIASATADPSIQGAANVTVTGGPGQIAVTISSINQNSGTASVPADLSNAKGQLDVILNVDQPQGVQLKSVQATLTCGTDSISASQSVSDAAPSAAEAAAAPVTLSFNTAAFNTTTGVPTVHNGACTISASATTTSGAQSAKNSTTLTLNNADVIVGGITASKGPVAGGTGLSWVGGDVTVSALPVFYTKGRSAVSATLTLSGTKPADGSTVTVGSAIVTADSTKATTATFPNASGTNSVAGLTLNPLVATATFIDNSGNSFAPGFATALPVVRLDNQKPSAGTYVFTTQNASHHWVGKAYVFDTTTAHGYTAATTGGPLATDNDLGGSGKVSVKYQFTTAPATSSSTWTDVAAASDIPNSPDTATYVLRMIESDAIGNATTTTLSVFGSDQNPPIASFSGGAKDKAAATTAAGLNGGSNFVIAYTDSASGFNTNPVLTTVVRNFELAKTAGDCVIGTWDATKKVCNSVNTAGTIPVDNGTGTDGYYTVTSTVVDQAGNATPVLTRSVLVDNTAPAAAGGVAIPATITGGTSASFTGPFTDNLDIVSVRGSLVYPAAGVTLAIPGTLDTPGTLFDNVLTKSANATVQISNFISDLQITAADAPPAAAGAQQPPNGVGIQVLDGAGNISAAAPVALPAANVVNGTGAAQFTTANFTTFKVSNAATNISHCPASGCAGGVSPANDLTVDLTAAVTGTVSQTANPFSQICYYYQDPVTTFWTLIGCQSAPAVTDVAGVRTWTYTLFAWTPPASLPLGPVNVMAIGQNTKGNGIATGVNANITLTNP